MNRMPAISNDVPIGKRIKGAEMLSLMPRPLKGRHISSQKPGGETAAHALPGGLARSLQAVECRDLGLGREEVQLPLHA